MLEWLIFITIMYVIFGIIHINCSVIWKADKENKWFRYKVQEVKLVNCETSYYILHRYLLLFPFLHFPIKSTTNLEALINEKDDMMKRDGKYSKVKRSWLKDNEILAKVI